MSVSFYVAGGALTVCALLVSVVGIVRPGFPRGRAEVAVTVAFLVFVAAAMVTAVATT